MDTETKDKLKKIAPQLLEDKDLPLFFKLEEIADSLKVISEKEPPELPEYPEPKEVEFPEVQKVEVINQMTMAEMKMDMKETNTLLKKLVDKEEKDIEINVNLQIV